jgi:GntR family transcriptional regulator, transcriptional repressor for pyruvate dehydrogenase complex
VRLQSSDVGFASSQATKAITLSAEVAKQLGDDVRKGKLSVGQKLPKETDLMGLYGVSRTVVREAISYLQAAGLVETKHGVGTYVRSREELPSFRVQPEQLATLRDTIALLEFRIAIESEAAAIAAVRRTESDLAEMQSALDAFDLAISRGETAAQADARFHLAIAVATQNSHFMEFMNALGTRAIPRARLNRIADDDAAKQSYLQRVQLEHEAIFSAIRNQDVDGARAAIRTHLSSSRERLKRAEAANSAQSTSV